MGFLGGSSKTTVPATGFASLHNDISNAFERVAFDISDLLTSKKQGGLTGSQFVPIGQTADETRAFDIIRKGFAPTPESIGADMSMLMNPFDQFVIDGINREAVGEHSILKQALNEAGQMGSNRSILGANDIDLTRLNQVGNFRQGQYNTMLDSILTKLPMLRGADAQGLLDIGGFERGLDLQTKQAPIQALLTAANALATQPKDGGQAAYTMKSGGSGIGGFGSILSGLGSIGDAGGIGSILGMGSAAAGSSGLSAGALALAGFSDRRLKENIVHVGEENGHKIYEFNYADPEKHGEGRFIGVMADEVQEKMPEAVYELGGKLAVNYDMIGVNFRRAE